jgi:glucosamine-phosphate N-acetyltransferase
MDDIIIRELEIDDLKNGFLESLDSLKPASTLSEEKVLNIFQKIKKNPFQLVFVVIKKSQVIGSATLILEQKFIHDGKYVGHIEDVVINKNFQKFKIGSFLIKTILKRAESEGCYKSVLDCLDDVAPFYEKMGFVRHLKGMRFNH